MTMSRRVRRITVSGYKSIDHVEPALGPVTVLVGPNGAGKSNFIEAVELLGRIADGELGMEVGLRGGGRGDAARCRQGVRGHRAACGSRRQRSRERLRSRVGALTSGGTGLRS